VDPERGSGVQRFVRTPNWTTLALIGGLIILALVVAYFASSRNPDQDKLSGSKLGQSVSDSKAPAPEKLCANNQTYDLIKRELFRRAAQLRGSDQTAFDQLSSYAVVRMENPVMENEDSKTGAVSCSGSLSLDLPPGVAIVGARRTLSADVDYTVQQAADGSGNVVLLRNADAIIAPLATLARLNQPTQSPEPQTAPPEQTNGALPQQPQSAPQPVAPQAPTQTQPSVRPSREPSAAHPSFDCAKARTKGELAVCSNAGLAALDRNMSSQYSRAMEDASPSQRDLLRSTRDRFLAYRDRCPNRSCIGDAYVGRMREIRDIMEGRWRPSR
jgi:uncharacterized protein YecT (DUF1311 family)